ncbi:MAG: 2-oxo acid dehydrogenase subunit E2 [bacterium]|nr:2-oxo acid dehydrogenase subunit E2 [bacterium]
MAEKIIMPKLGQISEELILLKWFKKKGEKVVRGEPLFEVLTDKANIEVEAVTDGVLTEIFVNEGEKAPALSIIGIISKPEEETKEVKSEERLKISPIARKLAKEYGIDLSKIKGTGPEGRIVKEDILKIIPSLKDSEFEIIPISGIRKVIAQRTVESKSTIPHFYLKTSIDMSEAVKFREFLNSYLKSKRQDTEVSYTALIVKASSIALSEFPILNALVKEDKIYIKKDTDIGVVVSVDDGMIIPVLHRVNKKGLIEIARELNTIVDKARSNKLTAEDLEGGSFTISNLGMYDIEEFTAIINPPEVAILAVGKIEERPVVKNFQIIPKWMMTVTLSCDHRVIDGVTGARFLEKLKTTLENPLTLIEEVMV